MQEFFKAQDALDDKQNRMIGRRGRFAVVLTLTALVAGCSSVPDAVNPVEWYKDARDYFVEDDQDTAAKASGRLARERGKPAPGAGKPFPKLSTVPGRPTPSSQEERKALTRGLVADRQPTRQYSTEVIRRQTVASNPLPDVLRPVVAARPPAVASTLAPAPRALPKPRVTVTPAQPQLAKLPALPSPKVTLKTPRMASVPAVIPPLSVASLGTVVISGSGVHTVGATGGTIVRPMVAARAPGRAATSRLKIPRPAPAARLRAPARQARANPAPAFPAGANGAYQVATILFDNGSSRLKSNDRRILRQVAAQQRQTGGVIRIVGHASSRTRSMDVIRHKMVNFEVSAARAESVAKALARMGAKPESMVIGAAADREPKYFEFMPSGEAGNRRAEIFIEY